MYKCKLCGEFVEDITPNMEERIYKHLSLHEEYVSKEEAMSHLGLDKIITLYFDYIPNTCTIAYDAKNNPIVIISDIRFMGKRRIEWEDVEEFLKGYVGSNYEVIETSDKIYIGPDFPNELKGSEDTKRLRGTNAKAKANSTQELPMLLRTAKNKRWQENYKSKHKMDAKFGWYRFTSRFALPVYLENEELDRLNVFRIEMLVRHASDGNLYLYDMVNIKKETSTPL